MTFTTGLPDHDVSLRLRWAAPALLAFWAIALGASCSSIDGEMALAAPRHGAGDDRFASDDRPPLNGFDDRFHDLSPRRDASGILDGRRDRPNSIAVDSDVLQVCSAHVIHNGEGDAWPHGPIGHIYIDFFASTEPLAESVDRADQRRLEGSRRRLRGPHRTHRDLDEWLDDELQHYQHFGVFQWSGRDAVVARIWESDGSEDGRWGRRNDVLGMELVNRADTLQGKWIPLHAYTNGHPRRRTSRIKGWLLVKTGGTCPR